MKTLISNATIVNEGQSFCGSIVIDNDIICDVLTDKTPSGNFDRTIDAKGCLVLPGIIDTHVHFREPGLTQKADMESESRAAAFGGITTYFDMPNTSPQTTSIECLEDKFSRAEATSHVNYSFFFGATNDNVDAFPKLDIHRIPGIKLFMGASTGNMLVDNDKSLETIFRTSPLPIMTHCEDSAIIADNVKKYRKEGEDDLPIEFHPLIRSREACIKSTEKAIAMAKKFGTRLHVAHISTKEELELIEKNDFTTLDKKITAEAALSHIIFCEDDYKEKGALIKCNPAIKSKDDRDAIRQALSDGIITTIGTDHAPHLITDKQGGALKATSGMPSLQFSLPSMLTLADQGIVSIERIAYLMAHNPARLFSIRERGFIRKGFKADLAIVCHEPFTVTKDIIQSKCNWSPLEGTQLSWRVTHTICNGNIVFENGKINKEYKGEAVTFR